MFHHNLLQFLLCLILPTEKVGFQLFQAIQEGLDLPGHVVHILLGLFDFLLHGPIYDQTIKEPVRKPQEFIDLNMQLCANLHIGQLVLNWRSWFCNR